MTKVYTIFSLVRDDVKLSEGKVYFFPTLNGSFETNWGMSGLIPIIFVKEDY